MIRVFFILTLVFSFGFAQNRALIGSNFSSLVENAPTVPFNTEVNGSLEFENDVDVYKFEIKVPDGVKFEFSSYDDYNTYFCIIKSEEIPALKAKLSDNLVEWSNVYDNYRYSSLFYLSSYSNYSDSKSINLYEETYYIVVYNSYSRMASYDFKITSIENEGFVSESFSVGGKYTQEDLDSAVSIAVTNAKEECKNDPASCGIEINNVETTDSSNIDLSKFQLNQDFIDNLSSGWHLIGSSVAISDVSIFKNVISVWRFDSTSQSWSLYNPKSIMPPEIGFDDFQGFWVKKGE